jgi:hypothetical protein
MWRRLRWILLALVVALVAAVVTAVIVEKPTLDDDEKAVDARWADLRELLTARYATLDGAVAALGAAGESERAVTKDLQTDLADWKDALDGGSPARQAAIANRLEGQGARLRANIIGSPRLSENITLTGAVAAYDSAAPPQDAIDAYNKAVDTYEADRTDTFRRVVATLFGFEARPQFSVPA